MTAGFGISDPHEREKPDMDPHQRDTENFIIYSTVYINVACFFFFKIRVAKCGSGIFIPDPNFFIPDTGSRVKKIPNLGSGSAPKNSRFFNQNILY
jgi:hypothetical protein